jgi:hypothetical protein
MAGVTASGLIARLSGEAESMAGCVNEKRQHHHQLPKSSIDRQQQGVVQLNTVIEESNPFCIEGDAFLLQFLRKNTYFKAFTFHSYYHNHCILNIVNVSTGYENKDKHSQIDPLLQTKYI